MAISLSSEEVDGLLAYFRDEVRYIHIGATYITPKEQEAVSTMEGIFRRCMKDKVTR